jgi:hypothetical protein
MDKSTHISSRQQFAGIHQGASRHAPHFQDLRKLFDISDAVLQRQGKAVGHDQAIISATLARTFVSTKAMTMSANHADPCATCCASCGIFLSVRSGAVRRRPSALIASICAC